MKYPNPGKPTPPSKPWTPPKQLLGHAMSGASSARSRASSFGKIPKQKSGDMKIPKE